MAFKRVSTTAFSKVSRVVWGNRFLIDLAVVVLLVVSTTVSSFLEKYWVTTVATMLIKLTTPSPITAVAKMLFCVSTEPPILALIPTPPKGVVKSTLPLKVKRGNISKNLHENIDKKVSYVLIFYQTRSWFG